jgi:hypothetical protein
VEGLFSEVRLSPDAAVSVLLLASAEAWLLVHPTGVYFGFRRRSQ